MKNTDIALDQSAPAAEDTRRAAYPAVGKRWIAAAPNLPNALTCDVEDYFQVSAFENIVSRDKWQDMQCRIPRNIDRILALYDDAGVTGTFFILGWVAINLPEVVRQIADAGHEVASHGMFHMRVWDMTADEFHADIDRAKKLLEDVCGREVKGFRAASWSLDNRTPWAHEKLAEAGYRYSSSIYPVVHDHYGVPGAPPYPYFIDGSAILEIPPTATRLLGRDWPAAGGGYFRLMPLSVSQFLLRHAVKTAGVPAVFYYHPWELDPDQPRVPGISLKTRFRHYVNLSRFETRQTKMLRDFRWERMDRIYLANEF